MKGWSNCLFWALLLLWHRRGARARTGRRGYLCLRMSLWGPFPHALYGERCADGRLRLVQYRPSAAKPRVMPPPLFRGKTKWGDF